DRGRRGLRVELEDERLVLGDVRVALAGSRGLDGRAAGREDELARTREDLAVEALESRPQPEGAADARGQIAREIVGPDARVHPAAGARLRARDVEGIRQPRVTQGHHGRRERRGRLADALDGALRRKRADLRIGRLRLSLSGYQEEGCEDRAS